MAVFDDKIYCAFQSSETPGSLWIATSNGQYWSPYQRVRSDVSLSDGIGMSESPSLIVYGSRLYCFYQGIKSNGELRYSPIVYQDPSPLVFQDPDPRDIPHLSSSVQNPSSSSTVQNSSTQNSQISYVPDDKQPWKIELSCSPSMTVFNQKLHCFYQGKEKNGELWFVFDDQGPPVTHNVPADGQNPKADEFSISESPSVVVFKEKLYCLHQGKKKPGQLWCSVFSNVPNEKKWPGTMILVHGYANSKLPVGDNANNNKGQEDNFWYWKGKYSDNKESYDVKAELEEAVKADGQQVTFKAANWDGRSKIEDSVKYLTNVLDKYCTGANFCDLVGHSTGDALIGYALDKFKDKQWNISTVFVAGGAGGGTEAATVGNNWDAVFNKKGDPLVTQLEPLNMRNLYNHNMSGRYERVPNIRFVGAGTKTDYANLSFNPFTGGKDPYIDYGFGANLCCGKSDGLVPFHSQGGVRDLKGDLVNAYCITEYTGVVYSCGRLNLGADPAVRSTAIAYVKAPLFDGFHIMMIDKAMSYNHSDEVGRLAVWIERYKNNPFPWNDLTIGDG